MSDSTEQFLDKCDTCGQCTDACPFLTEYGEPDEIIRNRPQKAFLCTNCTACNRLCPQDLQPSEALFQTKIRLIRSRDVPKATAQAVKAAVSFAERGHKTPFVHYSETETVFWPGCSLAGTSPETVNKTAKLLSDLLDTPVGLALDCCFDPLYQIGDVDPVKEAVARIQERLDEKGVHRLIVGCANCKKIFTQYPITQHVEYILEILPDDIIENLPDGDPYLHHPCPFFRIEGVPEKAKQILQVSLDAKRASGSPEPSGTDDLPDIFSGPADKVDEPDLPSCCGYGGSINSQDPDLAEKFTEKVTADSVGAYIVTSCMGCVNRFVWKNRETYHILDLVTGTKPIKKPVSTLKKWANRLKLARTQQKS
jgi:Fe-S oxidoreductase